MELLGQFDHKGLLMAYWGEGLSWPSSPSSASLGQKQSTLDMLSMLTVQNLYPYQQPH